MSYHEMNDDEMLRRYLLGKLDEEQSCDLERRLLKDDALFELAEAVEGDLLSAAARGTLLPAEREHVLRHLAASPEGRARYALIRGLTTVASETDSAKTLIFRMLPRPRLQAAALAASLAVAACGVWLATRVAIPGPPIHDISQSLSKKVQVFTLALTGMRDSGGGIPHLYREPGGDRVEIRLPLHEEEPLTEFAVSLRNVITGEQILSEESRSARQMGGGRALVLQVPTARLPAGTYEIQVLGKKPPEEPELLGQPMFEVRAP